MGLAEVKLPLFPLGLVLYPDERLPLHIFEPRYKEMIAFCLEYEESFGVVYYAEGKVAQVGCTAQIAEITKRYSDGRLDIVVTGQHRFRLSKLFHDKTYLQGLVASIDEPGEVLNIRAQERAITQHMRLLELAGRTIRPSLYERQVHISYVMAHNSGLSNEQKQELLETPGENARLNFLSSHFEELIPKIMKAETLRRKIQSNGHFKDFPPEI